MSVGTKLAYALSACGFIVLGIVAVLSVLQAWDKWHK